MVLFVFSVGPLIILVETDLFGEEENIIQAKIPEKNNLEKKRKKRKESYCTVY